MNAHKRLLLTWLASLAVLLNARMRSSPTVRHPPDWLDAHPSALSCRAQLAWCGGQRHPFERFLFLV
jgi:hypothetical protein